MASALTAKLSKFNPFGKVKKDEDDFGEAIDTESVAGGGHAARRTKITKEQLRVSHALKKFLVNQHVFSPDDIALSSDDNTPALKELLDKPHVNVPRELTLRGRPLTEYFISSSHNTYLLAHQLYGTSSAVAYETALNTGSRCVEIDAWDNEENREEPKVTHGYTLASHIPFRAVCETIRDVVDKEAAAPVESDTGYRAAPIMISLENHCDAKGQLRLATIMREVWGERLLSKPVRDEGTHEQADTGEHVHLEELGSKIAVIVEYHLPNEEESESSSDEDEDPQVREDHKKWREEKRKNASGGIIPELAELGVYAQSVKPVNHSWFEGVLQDGPPHHLINVSESGLAPLLQANAAKIGQHNAKHLMRVYPKGTRISSANLNPVPFWGVGAQICALNWQTFDASMQLNEALFAGTDGFVLKPAALRARGSGNLDSGRKKHLRLHIAGATDIPVPKDRDADDEIKPYVTCTLVHPHDIKNEPPKRKTSAYKQHKLALLHKDADSPPTDALWNEHLDWEYEENELVFLRILIKSDDRFARNPVFAVAAVRLMYVANEWVFIRMLDLKGKETHCTVLCRFEITDA
ncbi:hypothetical protein AC578_5643 [Pseudocercospora eumusae]|uniref:Phosphoinositide phospholipase C n=1 Tax=Pseudocercospora eumusae TaxID=321146 RepID=A0A139HT77_9PEZI|nr:hypothetical protein AC578_5643 [Pseudocercospora eumusae]